MWYVASVAEEVALSNFWELDLEVNSVFKISEISADISAIFRVSVNTDTIYPSDNRSTEISDFFCNYRRYFADISVFYRFFRIFIADISVLFTEPTLFMNSHISGHCS